MRCWYILCFTLVFGRFEAKSYIRRSHAIIASDGSIERLDAPFDKDMSLEMSDASFSMPVYKIHFQLDGRSMCWERETLGCRSSQGDCDVFYCDSADPSCECLLVGFRNCSSTNRSQNRMQLYTETMRFIDGDYPTHIFYWRQLRVKYYDNTEWNDHLRSRGKVLESSLSCNDVVCKCSNSTYFDFVWDGNRLVHIDDDGIKRSIGPSPLRGPGQAMLTLRQFNQRLKESKLTIELSHTYRRPTSTTTIPESTTEAVITSTTRKSVTSTTSTSTIRITTSAAPVPEETDDDSDEETTDEFSTTSGTGDDSQEEEEEDEEDDSETTPAATTKPKGGERGAKTSTVAAKSTSAAAKSTSAAAKSTTAAAKSTTAAAGSTTTAKAEVGTTTSAPSKSTEAASTTGAAQSTTKAASGSAKTTTTMQTTAASKEAGKEKDKTTEEEKGKPQPENGGKEHDEDEDENWDATKPPSTAQVTTTTTTLFCHCYLNVTWRSEAHGMAPAGPLGQRKLRRATVSRATSSKVGGCRKFCLQDESASAAALHRGEKDFCTCYTPDVSQPLYNAATRYQDEETVIGSWNIPEKSIHGYTKVVRPLWKSETIQARAGCPIDGSDCKGYFSRGCEDKAPLACHNAHGHSPYSTTLPLDVRPDDSFYISKACALNDNVVLCSNAWLVFDFEEAFTLTKMRVWNYATDEGIRKILVSSGKELQSLQEVQVFQDISNAKAADPPADLSMRGQVPKQPHPLTEMTFDVPVTGRFLKIEILQNYGGQGVGFFRTAFDGFKSPFTNFMAFPGKSCGGYELEDLNGNFTLPELYCRALCSSRMDCAAFEVVYSGPHAGRCIFHSNIWIPTKALDDDRDCYIKDNQVVYCRNGLPFQDVCCSSECGVCGGDKCSWRPGGRERCCAGAIRALRDFCTNKTDVACRIPRPRRAGTPTLRLTFERNGTSAGNESDIIPKGLQVSKFQASTLSRAGGTAADLTGVNTGIDIKGYQDWFTVTSTFMCWIKPTFVRDQTWYFVFRSSGYAMHDPKDGSWAVEFHCREDKCRLMIWTRQPAGLGAVATEYKAKKRWEKWTHIAVVLRVGGAFPQLYLNGQPEEVEDSSTPWSELEDIVYDKNQFLIIGKATETDQQFDGYIDHFEVYEEILSPQFIRKHYSFVEAVAAAGDGEQQVCLPPIDTTGYIILEGSATRVNFQVEAKCDEANGFGGKAKVMACSSSSKRYVLGGCLQKEQCPLRRC